MANPFTTRATEFVKSNEAFLTLVAPNPVSIFLKPYAKEGGLYNRLVSIQGQPGSGKTTIARLFEFATLAALLRGAQNETYSELIGPLQDCDAIHKGLVNVIGCRLPLESDYRELWQLPYSESVRNELLQKLIQARAVLAWFGQLRRVGITPSNISLEALADKHASLESAGGKSGDELHQRARAIEAAIYRIVGALLPPPEDKIEAELIKPYRPFEVIDKFRLNKTDAESVASGITLRPFVILDDAHFLHGAQLGNLKSWLTRRELSIGRWILSRLDVLQPKELFDAFGSDEPDVSVPGVTAGRDIIRINLQSTKRAESRKNFRVMARDMSKKYLGQMRIFSQNSITTLEEILPEKVDSISRSNIEKLQQSVRSAAKRLNVSDQRITEFYKMASDFLGERGEDFDDLKWAVVKVLLHRYAKRVPQASLFPGDEGPEPAKPLKVDLGVLDGAKVHLFHSYERPFYVGFDTLCDAASENAEAFLHLASHIVETAENLLIKQKPSVIDSRDQHKLLVSRASSIVDAWSFPECRRVRVLADWIASRCKQRTLEPNAPLDHGANAYGILQEEFDQLASSSLLAKVLKYAVAYNAFTLVPSYPCKTKHWCLLELGGTLIVKAGLPFKRGGFVEGSIQELEQHIQETE